MRFPLLLLLLLLPGCGFSPVYGQRQSPQLASVALANIPERDGQQLRLALADRLYGEKAPLEPARYLLEVQLEKSTENLSIQRNDVATRARLSMTALYTLRDRDSGKVVTSGRERSFISYNILTTPYATIAAEESARTRGVQALANMLASRLALALAQQP